MEPIHCVNVNIDTIFDFDVNVYVDATCEKGLSPWADRGDKAVNVTLTLPACRRSDGIYVTLSV